MRLLAFVISVITTQASFAGYPPQTIIMQLPLFSDLRQHHDEMLNNGRLELFIDDFDGHLDVIMSRSSIDRELLNKRILVSRVHLKRLNDTQFQIIDVEAREPLSDELIFKRNGVIDFKDAIHPPGFSPASSGGAQIYYRDMSGEGVREIRFALLQNMNVGVKEGCSGLFH